MERYFAEVIHTSAVIRLRQGYGGQVDARYKEMLIMPPGSGEPGYN